MVDARCDDHAGEPFPRRCAACDQAAADDAASRRADQVRACELHIRLLPCPECASETALSDAVSLRDAFTGVTDSHSPIPAAARAAGAADRAAEGEGSQNLAPEPRWDRLG